MRSFEIIRPEINRPGPRLQPKRSGAASIKKDSECIPCDPGVILAKVNPVGLKGRDFKHGVHIFVPGLKFSINHNARLSTLPLLIVFEAPKPVRAAVAEEVGVKNPAEKSGFPPESKTEKNQSPAFAPKWNPV
jgi:hypothetical protein